MRNPIIYILTLLLYSSTTLSSELNMDPLNFDDLKNMSLLKRIETLRTLPESSFSEEINETSLMLGREGNGGNKLAQEFSEIGVILADQLEAQDRLEYSRHEKFNGIDLQDFIQVVNNTKVFSVDYKLCSKSNDKSCPKESGFLAKNYPELMEIHIDAEKWTQATLQEKFRIVFHEYLGILGIEQNSYQLSSSLILDATQQASHKKNLCQVSLLDKVTGQVYSTAFTGTKYILDGGLSILTNQRGQTSNYVLSYTVSTGYLVVQVKEGIIKNGIALFKENGEEIIEESVLIKGPTNGSKRIETDDYLLHATCSGL